MISIENVSEDLYNYINKKVLPIYAPIDDGHGTDHIRDVIEWSFRIANKLDDKELCKDVIYASAAYHDIGNVVGERGTHHIDSFVYVLEDKGLQKVLSTVRTFLIATACMEHRASYTEELTSIYSKIVSDADRCSSLNIESMISRSYQFTSSRNPNLTDIEIFEEVFSHLREKYGEGGYMSFNLQIVEDLMVEEMINTQTILANKDSCQELTTYSLKALEVGAYKKLKLTTFSKMFYYVDLVITPKNDTLVLSNCVGTLKSL